MGLGESEYHPLTIGWHGLYRLLGSPRLSIYRKHFAIAGLKYTVKVSRRGPQSFRVFLGSSHVDVVARKLNDGGLLVQVCSLTLLSPAHAISMLG